MIAELGLALLWIAAALACLSLVAGTLYLRGGQKDLAALVRPASVAISVSSRNRRSKIATSAPEIPRIVSHSSIDPS